MTAASAEKDSFLCSDILDWFLSHFCRNIKTSPNQGLVFESDIKK